MLPTYGGLWVRVKDDGRAEAAMIAVYGARVLLQTGGIKITGLP
jgi:hypothetical protein